MATDTGVVKAVPDPIAWGWDLRPGYAGQQPWPYHRFRLRIPMRGERPPFLPVARARHTALYVNAFEPGRGEVNLHAHDDEAVWLVLAGEVTFWTAGHQAPRHLTQHQGLFIPAGTPYRYQNTGDGLLVMLRGGARPDVLPISVDFPVGTRPGGLEPIAWRPDLWPGVPEGDQAGPFRRFTLRLPLRGEGPGERPWRPLVRGTYLALHASCLEPGRGEVNRHSHDDEAIWVVLHGETTFWGWEDDREIGVLRSDDGIVIPRDAHYRYQNTGDGYLVMLRYGGRAEPVPPLTPA